ncbi:MAG: hypothetical protein C0475_07845, partial [Planctomyces sp.]|nr:hypothetical protein [Planctomyces sp.]
PRGGGAAGGVSEGGGDRVDGGKAQARAAAKPSRPRAAAKASSLPPERLDIKPPQPVKPAKPTKGPRAADDLGELPFAAPSRAEEAALAVNAAQRGAAADPPAPGGGARTKPRVRWDPKTGKMVPVEPAGLF